MSSAEIINFVYNETIVNIHKSIPVNQLYSTDEESKALETIVSL